MKSRHAISSRGWIILFALTLLLLAGLLAGFNVVDVYKRQVLLIRIPSAPVPAVAPP